MALDMEEVNREVQSPGLGGLLRVIAVLAVVIFGLIGALAVTGQIPQDQVQDWFLKAGMLLGIIVAVALAIRLITAKKG
jgi:hypothetical protein